MELVNVKEDNRELVNSFIRDHWCTTEMALRGKLIDMTLVDGIMALDGKRNITGLVTYMIRNAICEITSLDSLEENRGTGTTLVQEVIRIAKEQKCGKIEVITTNDNIHALRFYQKRGFDMAGFYYNSLEVSRRLKPEIPLIGENGIPLKHEILFEMLLDGQETR